MGRVVAVDTNFLLIPGRKHKDVIAELIADGWMVVVPIAVLDELGKLAAGRSQTALAAKIALQLIKQKGLKTLSSSRGYADEAILAYCKAHKAAAATQDLALRRKLRSAGIPVVSLNRSGKLTGG